MFLENLKFFKSSRHKQFNYQPRYYNEQKEDLQRRVEAARRDADNDRDYSRDALRARIDFRTQGKHTRRTDLITNMRILFIAVILGFVCYLIFS